MPTETVRKRNACKTLMGVQIIGTGSYVPDSVITNLHVQSRFGCRPQWIVKLTGIRERRHALANQATSDLCVEAAKKAMDAAGVTAKDIDLLLVATITPDMAFPSAACMVQDRLGMTCAAVDVQAACAGFMYALVTGAAYVASGASDMTLIIGADCMSRVVNPDDIKTFPLFGDGAGAVVLTRGSPEQGLVRYSLGSDGSGSDLLIRPGCGSRLPPSQQVLEDELHFMKMDGRSVFNWAASHLCDNIQEILEAAELDPQDVDLYIPHQANIRIINAAIDVLGINRDRVFNNLDKYGNTSAGSIPLALDEAIQEGRVKPGNLVCLSGFGSGLVWGTAIVRW